MKKFLIILSITLYTVAGYAKENYKNIILLSSENRNLVFAFHGLEEISTSLTITKQDHTVLFQETKTFPELLEHEFSLSNQSGDIFTIQIENEFKSIKTTYQFDSFQNKAIQLGNQERIFKPVFIKKEHHVMIYLLNPLEQKVVIEIMSKNGRKLMPKITTSNTVIKKSFDFSSYTSSIKLRVKNGKHFNKEYTF